jgi:ribosomal protein S18 acetylase RimI-like enzyme
MDKIKISDTTVEEIKEFEVESWKPYDLKHYGKVIPWEDWAVHELTLKAEMGKEIQGTLTGYHILGVYYLSRLIVKLECKGKGIGPSLLKELEKKLKMLKVHKIVLETGKDWDSIGFYEKHGFTKTGELPVHFQKKDFVIYSKLLI